MKKSPGKPAEVKPWWGAADTAGKSPWSLPSLPAPTAAPRASEDHWSKRKRRKKKSVETAGGWNAHRTQQAAIPASCFSSPWERAAEAAGKHALQNSLHLGTWHLRFSWRLAEAAVSLSAHVTPRPYGNHRAEQFQISLQKWKSSSFPQQLTRRLRYAAGKSTYSWWLGKVAWNTLGSCKQAALKYSCLFKTNSKLLYWYLPNWLLPVVWYSYFL